MILDGKSMKDYSVYIRDIFLNPLDNGSMEVKVRLSVKQKTISELPANQSVMLLLSTDGGAQEIYNNRGRLVDILRSPKSASPASQIRIIPLTAFNSGKKKEDDFIETTNLNGMQCRNYDTEITFSVDRASSDMNLFAMSYKTMGPPSTFFLRGGPPSLGVSINNIVSESILTGGETNSTSTFFLTNDIKSQQVFWLGGTHQDSQGNWRKGRYFGTSQNPSGNPLEVLEVMNTKIKDLRGMQELDEIRFSLQRQIFDLRTRNNSKMRRQSVRNIEKNSYNYLSDILYSKTSGNNLSYYFAINYLEMVRRNALYADMYSRASVLLNTCDVISMNIIRRRVKAPNYYNKLTAGGAPNRLFDNKVEKVNSGYSILNLNLPNPGVLNIVGSDPDMDDITFGLYEYGIEMEIVDNSDQKLLNMSKNLQESLNSLEALLKRATMENNYNAITNTFKNSFLALLENEEPKPWNECAQLYGDAMKLLWGSQSKINDTKLNKIVLDLSKMGNPALYGYSGPQFVIETIQQLINSINLILNNTSHLSQNTSKAIVETSNSQFGKRIRTFKIQQFFQKPFDADSLLPSGLDYFRINEKSTDNDAPLGRISYKRWEEILNNQSQKTGRSLTTVKNIYITPNFINLNSKKTRIYSRTAATASTHELDEAVYGLIEANMTRTSPLSFGNSVSQLNSNQTTLTSQQTATIQNQISMMNYNNCELILFDGPSENLDLSSITDPCSINQNTELSELVDSALLLSDTSKFITNPPEISVSGNSNPDAMNPELTTTFSNPLTQINQGNSLIANYLLENDFFNGSQASMTNNLKSLRHGGVLKTKNISVSDYKQMLTDQVLTADTPSYDGPLSAIFNVDAETQDVPPPEEIEMVDILLSDTLEPQNMATFALQYGFIQKVEYLAGYGISSNVTSVSSLMAVPIWRSFTFNKFIAAKEQRQLLVCRMKPHSTHLSNFKGISVSNYNEVFLLGNVLAGGLPSSSPTVSSGKYQMLGSLSSTYSNIKEYSISYNMDVRVGDQSLQGNSLRGSPSLPFNSLGLTALKGSTSFDAGHRHQYTIDTKGNGTAKEVCDPQNASLCHTHQIVGGVVRPASSVGNPVHTHNLRRSAHPPSRRSRSSRRGRSRGRTTPQQGGAPSTGGGSGGGGY